MLEALIVAACFYGNGDSCNSGLNGYVKYYKLDERAQKIDDQIKKEYPTIHLMGVTVGSLAYRRYNFLLYNNTWVQLDYSTSEKISKIVYKIEF